MARRHHAGGPDAGRPIQYAFFTADNKIHTGPDDQYFAKLQDLKALGDTKIPRTGNPRPSL